MSDKQKPRKSADSKKAEKAVQEPVQPKGPVEQSEDPGAVQEEHRASPKKRAVIFAVGLLLLVVGFLVLNQANATADNMAGKISPLLILGGYGVIFWSLWI